MITYNSLKSTAGQEGESLLLYLLSPAVHLENNVQIMFLDNYHLFMLNCAVMDLLQYAVVLSVIYTQYCMHSRKLPQYISLALCGCK